MSQFNKVCVVHCVILLVGLQKMQEDYTIGVV